MFFPDQDKLNMAALKQIALKMIEINCFNSIVIIKGATQISKRVSIFYQNVTKFAIYLANSTNFIMISAIYTKTYNRNWMS